MTKHLAVLLLLCITAIFNNATIIDEHCDCPDHGNILTTGAGAPVDYRDTYGLNKNIFTNEHYINEITHLVRERIPPRCVQANGAGAFGYFEVTNDITHICKANLFSKVGKKTPIAVRLSLSIVEKGAADTSRDSRGFSIKFYTEEGNFDIAGFNTPMFFVKDPVVLSSLVHAVKPNPVTGYTKNGDMVWDFVSFHPEIIHLLLVTYGDRGIPKGYPYMPGYAIHTYQVSNSKGDIFFCRFHFLPDAGIKNMLNKEAAYLAGSDPDHHKRDLFTRIENGEWPTWTMYLQILSPEDVRNAKFDVFDVTKVLPLKKYPLTPVGRLVLNRNPTNYFADIEEMAFNPASLVHGIQGPPDKIFEARRMAYRDAQNYRLGGNHENIPVNRPICGIRNYARDGVPPLGNIGPGPNYYPNTFGGPKPYEEENKVDLVKIVQDDSDNFEQAAELYNEMTSDERDRLVENLVGSINSTTHEIKNRIVRVFMRIHAGLGFRIKKGLE